MAIPQETGSGRTRLIAKVAMGLWVVAVAVVFVHVWVKPESNTLYKVFRAGGARWLASENLYPKVDEYIYSPFAAAFFAPLALLPDKVAGILWRMMSLAAYAGAFAMWLRARGTPERKALAWVLLLPLSVGDIFNGQANPLVIGLLMVAVLECRQKRWMIAALCVGVAAYFKVYPLAMGLLLAVFYPRQFAWRLAVMLAALFGISLVLQRPAYALAQYGNWIHTLGEDPRRTLNYYGTYRDFWLVLRVLRVPISMRGWAVVQAVSGMAVAAYLWLAQRRGVAAEKLDFLLLALGTCWMLLFGPATESATYVILAPALVVAWVRWGDCGFCWSVVSCYGLLIVSQMLSAWGHQYQNAFTHLVQPVGAMVFAAGVVAYGNNEKNGNDGRDERRGLI